MLLKYCALSSRALLIATMALISPVGRAQDNGCGGTGLASGTYTIPHAGLQRTFKLLVPFSYNNRVPSRMVLIFHGWGGDENEFLRDPRVIQEANSRGYIVVAPRGIGAGPPDNRNNSWTFRGSATGRAANDDNAVCDTSITPRYTYPSCQSRIALNSCSWTQCQDNDVEFVVALVQHLQSSMCVDAGHVFAAGGSNGGMFTWELGQNPRTAPLFKAIAPLIGLPHRGYLDGPGRSGKMPVLLITGLSDNTVPPGAWDDPRFTTTSNDRDRFYYTGATAITRVWAAAAGCKISPKEIPVDVGSAAADCRSYCTNKDSEWPAVLDCRARMGHDYGLPWSWNLMLDFFDRQ